MIATLTALYVGGALSASSPGATSGSTFHQPTFTTEELEALQIQRASALEGDIYVGGKGKPNRHKAIAPADVFQPQPGVTGRQQYIVQLEDKPVATYDGGLEGYAPTRANKNRAVMVRDRVLMSSAPVKAYSQHLLDRQSTLLRKSQSAGANIAVKRNFTLANNAMLVEMTQDDAEIMARQPGVKRITPNRIFQLNTDRGPEFIGATRLWDGSGSPSGLNVKGEGMVVGIVDTGINTDHPAFAGDNFDPAGNPLGNGVYAGDCASDASLCNDKLIGVFSYPEITDVYRAPEFQERPWDTKMIRPANGEDYHGHGSHTASTVAGNRIENTPLQGFDGSATSDGVDLDFQFPHTSGVAPEARIMAFQVCWPGNGGDPYAGCPESALLSAFEDAIASGVVDVINFSIGGAENFPWDDPMELAFLSAREAGISVAAAAGNSGPNYFSADHTSPWVTTVGASTHDRVMSAGDKTLSGFEGSGYMSYTEIPGKSFSGGITGEVVLAENYPDPDTSDEYTAASCNVPFPAGTFTADQIVICERGVIARVEKAQNVAAGGAGGFILQNLSTSETVVADSYVLPGIHVEAKYRWTLKNWVNSSAGTARATISDFTNSYEFVAEEGNNLAVFSSMGPSRTNDTLVPDLTAPGVQIYAANADDQPFTAYPAASDWTFMSGTSMAAPHTAGAMTLLKQLHPEWTPAEIQSALMLTAGPVYLKSGEYRFEPYTHFMVGAGAINVERAANTGLVMDETIENYLDANPRNGGIASQVNLASMANSNCEGSCTWLRTVTATKDGVWNATGFGKQAGVEIEVSPSRFSLKAGEKQSIVVRATLPAPLEHKVEPEDPSLPWDAVQNNFTYFDGTVVLTEVNGNSPELHMPVVAANVHDELPLSVNIDASRDQGSETLMVSTGDYSQLTPRYYGLVQPEVTSTTLESVSAFLSLENIEKGWSIQTVEVPENTVRFVAESLSAEKISTAEDMNPRYFVHHPFIIVGRDLNGSGGFIPSASEMEADPYALSNEYHREVLCVSSSYSEDNFCNFQKPEAGSYWVATVNTGDFPVVANTGVAMLSANSAKGNLSVSGPAAHDGNGEYPLTVSWDLPDSRQGEKYYGGFDLGNMPGAEGTLGFTSVNISRGEDAVQWSVSQDKARALDVIDFKVKIRPNLESDDRNYDLKIDLPDGMRLLGDSILANNEALQDAVQWDDHSLSLAGLQSATRNIKREYVMTSNIDDQMCHTPLIDEYSTGGYIDLKGEFGIQPNADWLAGDYRVNYDVPIWWLFGNEDADFRVYNQSNAGYVRMHTVGALQFNTAYWTMSQHRGPGFLYESLAPFWRGSFEMKYRRHYEDPWGLTIAAQYADERPDLGDLLFLEYDNVTDKNTGDEYDFQAILRSGIDDREGRFEIIYAYDNLGANLTKGVVMTEGFDSAFSGNAGPKNGMLHTVAGYDDLDTKLSDDLVLCFDYVGPEKSLVEVTFQALVQPAATGANLEVTFTHDLQGQPQQTEVHPIAVKGNIQLAEIADMTVAENGRIEGIDVLYTDANEVPNTVFVSGEHISAGVNGYRFDLIPAANFHGKTLVTVTVQDNEHAGDAASTSFMLTVVSDGEEPGCTDIEADNYDENATRDDGSCTYPQPEPEPESQPEPEEPKKKKKKSGGSTGTLMLALLIALGLGRRLRMNIRKQ
ncbi:S8 family serine peptidase [Microbulbifer pacificus]|uniref:S8 family serine peptidase n=1 Tax=Microbulbifer pacificus TaxID=407164 RepID=UPI0018F886F6|nr:S8 family serine peptidase [Microbulbifer pacificus]